MSFYCSLFDSRGQLSQLHASKLYDAARRFKYRTSVQCAMLILVENEDLQCTTMQWKMHCRSVQLEHCNGS